MRFMTHFVDVQCWECQRWYPDHVEVGGPVVTTRCECGNIFTTRSLWKPGKEPP